MGKKKERLSELQREKELLEIENLKLQKKEKLASIISTIVITAVAIITAILNWLSN